MFLMILEDGSILRSQKYEDGDLLSCDEGLMDLIDISDPQEPKSYYEGAWVPVEVG